jgi:hypothetical protein
MTTPGRTPGLKVRHPTAARINATAVIANATRGFVAGPRRGPADLQRVADETKYETEDEVDNAELTGDAVVNTVSVLAVVDTLIGVELRERAR